MEIYSFSFFVRIFFILVLVNCEKPCLRLSYKHQHNSVKSIYGGVDNKNLTYSITGELGNVTFWFKKKLKEDSVYTVQLLVNEEIKNCSLQQNFHLHSEVKYHTTMNHVGVNSTNFENGNEVHFLYVFSGCYKLSIKLNDTWESDPFEMTTQYNKTLLTDEVLYKHDVEKTDHSYTFEIEMNENYAHMHFHPTVIMSETISDLYVSKQHLCKIVENGLCEPLHGLNYKCTFKNLNPGEYTMITYLQDEYVRCNPFAHEIWLNISQAPTEACIWVENITIPNYTIVFPPHKVPYSISVNISVAVIAIMFVGIAIYVLIYTKCFTNMSRCKLLNIIIPFYKIVSRDDDMVNPNLGHKEHKDRQILLIYPRECEVFQEVVTNFKKMLLGIHSSHIYDIYELDEKCSNPQNWIEDKFKESSVKIILFLNMTASLLNKHDFKLEYKNPHAFDNLFPYALQLTRSYANIAYHNLFVVSVVTDFTEFQFLNPLTRYTFPQHTIKLLNDLDVPQHDNNKLLIETFNASCECYASEISRWDYSRDIIKNVFMDGS